MATDATHAAEIRISGAWIPAAPPASRMLAGYLDLHNGGSTPLVVTGAAGEDFGRVEIHRSTVVDGTARMRRQDRVEIAPGETLRFEPGGLHLMLMRPGRTLHPGDTTRLELITASGTRLDFSAEVRHRNP